jgi:hypothetical protein
MCNIPQHRFRLKSPDLPFDQLIPITMLISIPKMQGPATSPLEKSRVLHSTDTCMHMSEPTHCAYYGWIPLLSDYPPSPSVNPDPRNTAMHNWRVCMPAVSEPYTCHNHYHVSSTSQCLNFVVIPPSSCHRCNLSTLSTWAFKKIDGFLPEIFGIWEPAASPSPPLSHGLVSYR